MKNLVFLPATDPGDMKYGTPPERITGFPDASTHKIRYPNLVWYNKSVCDEAVAQIRAFNVSSVILVGFSKSGLGAWNISRTIPKLVTGTIIFDAPVTRRELPPWGTAPFYTDDASWQEDLPINTIEEYQTNMPVTHQLVLISGVGFHDEMLQFSDELSRCGCRHVYLPRPRMEHHWNSGWIEEGLRCM